MSASEGIANFTATIGAIVPIVALYIAWLGLNTWKAQIRWQQGRGLAVSLLQSLGAIRRSIEKLKTFGYPTYDGRKDIAERERLFEAKSGLVLPELDRLEDAVKAFEHQSAEALILWNNEFSDISSVCWDLQYEAKSACMSGLNAMDPKLRQHERENHFQDAGDMLQCLRGHKPEGVSATARVKELESQLLRDLRLLKLA